MRARLGPADARDDFVHLLVFHNLALERLDGLDRLPERDRGRHVDADEDRAFFKRRDEFGAKPGVDEEAETERDKHGQQHGDAALDHDAQQDMVHGLEHPQERQLFLRAGLQQIRAQRGRGERYQQRTQDREHERERHRLEHLALDSLQREDRREHEQDDDDREEHRPHHFPCTGKDHVIDIAVFVGLVVVEMAEDVLDHDGRAVAQHADRDGNAAE